MYRIEIDGIRVLHLGDLGHVLSPAQVDVVGIDVLFIPVGGVYDRRGKAAQVISDLAAYYPNAP
jgi:L-ascorbate metabolism protein UlaG (beta-lactamase superfamily)